MVHSSHEYSYGPLSIGRLLSHFHKYTRSYMSKRLKEYHISGPTFGYLFFLYRKDGLTEKEITDHMLVDKATTTRAISKLGAQGYVRKEQDPDDRRAFRIYLTAKAEDMRPRMHKLKKEWNEIVLKGFDEKERVTLLNYLHRIEVNLEEEKEMDGC